MDAVTLAMIKGLGGGGSSLPSVSAADNGKVLAVENGAWAASEQGKKFIVTLTPTSPDYSGTMDKTAKEITDAYNAGQDIWFKITTFPGFDDVEIPCNSVTFATGYTNGCFHGEIIETAMGVMIVILTSDANDNSSTYSTTIYSLTPAS